MEGAQQAKEKDLILGVTNTGQLAYLHVLRVEQDCIIGWPVNLPKHKEVSIPHGAYKVLVSPSPHARDPLFYGPIYWTAMEKEKQDEGEMEEDHAAKEGPIQPHPALEIERDKMREKLADALYAGEERKEAKLDDLFLRHGHAGGTEMRPGMNLRGTLTDDDVQRIAKAVWDVGGKEPVQTPKAMLNEHHKGGRAVEDAGLLSRVATLEKTMLQAMMVGGEIENSLFGVRVKETTEGMHTSREYDAISIGGHIETIEEIARDLCLRLELIQLEIGDREPVMVKECVRT